MARTTRTRSSQTARTPSLTGNASRDLEMLFQRNDALRPRKRPPRFHLAEEERRYGQRFPAELRALLALQERYQLGDLDDVRLFFFDEEFVLDGKDAAKRWVAAGKQRYWPVYYRAHLWGAYPIGATNGGDYYLASLEPGDRSRVYLYDHEEGGLWPSADSISALVVEASEHEQDAGKPVPAHFRNRGKAPPLWDVKALAGRDEWVTELLKGEELTNLHEATAGAPGFGAWSKERARLSRCPHLLLYWLSHHAFAGNVREFAEARRVAARSKNALVRSLGEALAGFVASRAERAPRLFNTPPEQMRGIVDALDRELPERLLSSSARADRKNSHRAANRATAQALRGAGGQDPLAIMESNPDDLALHRKMLGKLAARRDPLGSQAKTLLGLATGKLTVSWQGAPPAATAFLEQPDARLVPAMLALVRSGLKRTDAENRLWDALVAALGRTKQPAAIECLVEQGTKYRAEQYRLFDVLSALDQIDDPRRVRLGLWALGMAVREDGWHLPVQPAVAAVHRYEPTKAATIVARGLEKLSIGGQQDLHVELAHAARVHHLQPAWKGLVRLLEKGWTGKLFRAVAWALGVLDPARASCLLTKCWNDNKTPSRELGLDERAGLLAGLLVASPEDPRWIAEASAILDRSIEPGYGESSQLQALRYVLVGVREARITKLAPRVERHVRTGKGKECIDLSAGGQDLYNVVRMVARSALEALHG